MRILGTVIAGLLLLCIGGCGGSLESVTSFFQSGPWWQTGQVDQLRARARAFEENNELGLALDHWRLAHRIAMGRPEDRQEIARLETVIAAAVQEHHRQGLSALGRKQPIVARNHFLSALRLNPEYEPALKQIRSRFSPFPFSVYQCVAGDRPATVARKIWGDEKKAFLVGWFNHLPEDRSLEPGQVLILPRWKAAKTPQAPEAVPPDWLAEARERMAQDDLEGALAVAQQADASHPDVQRLISTLRLRLAQQRIEALELEKAGELLTAVPDGNAGKQELAAHLAAIRQKQRFDRDLARARSAFDQGLYAQSLDQSLQLLNQVPDSHDAAELAAESRYRLAREHYENQRYLSARTILAEMEGGHQDGAALKARVQAHLVDLAQYHYRNGVKHFINEDLRKAIAEWETALACDPNHTKARENITNARRLQKKLEALP